MMREYRLSKENMMAYQQYLTAEEKSRGTIEKYFRDINALFMWLDDRKITKEIMVEWKDYLQEKGYAPTTANCMISSINGLFRFLGWEDCRMKFIKIQRRLFRDPGRELTRQEYVRLVNTSREQGKERLTLLMETIGATGIRVSEVKYITVEAAHQGRAEISMKGKIRVILLSTKLCRKLLKFAKKQKITSGVIFRTKSGRNLSRYQIWAELKSISEKAKVEPEKVFPHNFRHLFATVFYEVCKDIVKLADVLGHSNIETTRIYLLTSGKEHQRQINRLRLVL